MMWWRDIELIPDTNATGAAINNGQGEATTITSAKRVKFQPPIAIATKPIINETIVNGTA